MSKVFIEEETLIGIGNAIREKNGTTDLIATTDMASAISNLPTGGNGNWVAVNDIVPVLASQYNTNTVKCDLSQYIGTNDNIPFCISLSSKMYQYTSNAGSLTLFYDGNGNFIKQFAYPNTSNTYVGSSYQTASLTEGYLTLNFTLALLSSSVSNLSLLYQEI